MSELMIEPVEPTEPVQTAQAEAPKAFEEELLVEDVSIDGMCGVH